MKVRIFDDAETVARAGALTLAATARQAIAARGAFHVALSGGGTPNRMFEILASLPCDWPRWHIWQVDERAAPNGHSDRNIEALMARLVLTGPGSAPELQETPPGLLDPTPETVPDDIPGKTNVIGEERDSTGVGEGEHPVPSIDHDLSTQDRPQTPAGAPEAPPPQPRLPVMIHPMRVTGDLPAGAAAYAEELQRQCEGILDCVHLGVGDDGHTASLIQGDPGAYVLDADVAATGPYHGWPRLTLTYRTIARARSVLWIVSGAGKQDALRKLVDGDEAIPAARVERSRATLFADAPAWRAD